MKLMPPALSLIRLSVKFMSVLVSPLCLIYWLTRTSSVNVLQPAIDWSPVVLTTVASLLKACNCDWTSKVTPLSWLNSAFDTVPPPTQSAPILAEVPIAVW